MALTECPECAKSVSDKAQSCPSCGVAIAMPQTNSGGGKREFSFTFPLERTQHLILLAGFAGLGLFSLSDVELLTNGLSFAALAVAVYFVGAFLRHLFQYSSLPSTEVADRMRETLDLIGFTVCFALVSTALLIFADEAISAHKATFANEANSVLFWSTATFGATVYFLTAASTLVEDSLTKRRTPSRDDTNENEATQQTEVTDG